MEKIQMILAWWNLNGGMIAAMLLALIPVAELIVRITPTTKDDGAVQRAGYYIRWFFDKVKVPDYKTGGGIHPTIEEKEKI